MKSDFVCSICNKIFNKPISFSCGCTFCSDHLNDKQVQKTNTIKCKKCNINYNIKELESLKPNQALENMLSRGDQLNGAEKALKQQIEQDLNELYKLCDVLREKNSLLEVEVYDHFVELRRKIDIRREEAKTRIDDIYMEMIDLAKQVEAQYMEHLKRQAQKALVRNGDDSLEEEIKHLAEDYRDPKLLVAYVRAMKTKHEEDI